MVADLSNIAAGLEVERLCVTPVFRSELEEELRRDEILEKSCETI